MNTCAGHDAERVAQNPFSGYAGTMTTQNGNRVIVAGCGPVGAVMRLALVRKGIPVTLIEQLPDAAEDQRAATVHPPTVEILVELGLETEAFADDASGGMSARLVHFRDRSTGDL